MPTADYHFITHWHVPGTVAETYAIISQPRDLVRWWPAVYLDLQERAAAPTDPAGQGNIFSLYTKGWLPYTLRWQFRVTEIAAPHRIALRAWGDFDGRGIWTFVQDGPAVAITYDWQIRADKPLLKYGSFLFKPIFAANHRWAMAKGAESLKLELARRHATSPQEFAQIPKPPAATTTSPLPLLVALAALLAGIAGWGWFRRSLKGAGRWLTKNGWL